MSAPEIIGEPAIRQDGGSVFCEVTVKNVDKTSAKWFVGEKPATGDAYKFDATDDKGNTKLSCQIVNFNKDLAGVYKVEFANASGSNHSTFNLAAGNAPEFTDKPHIAQRDGGAVIVIKCRGKSHIEMTSEWHKDDKPVEFTDRVKNVVQKDNKDKDAFQFNLEIHGPEKGDEGKYTVYLKNAEGSNCQSLNLCFD